MSLETKIADLAARLADEVNTLRSEVAARTPVVKTVPVGTTGFESEPDGTLWVEYTP
jgi:hypothetical protein